MSGRRTLRLLRRLGSAASLLAAALPGLAAKPEFGPNALVLDSSMPSQAIQKQIDVVYATQQHNEFGPQKQSDPAITRSPFLALIALKKRSGIGCWIGMVMILWLQRIAPSPGRRNLLTCMAPTDLSVTVRR